MKIEIATPDFFALSPKKIVIESPAQAGRTYFIYRGEIVAVGKETTSKGDQQHANRN